MCTEPRVDSTNPGSWKRGRCGRAICDAGRLLRQLTQGSCGLLWCNVPSSRLRECAADAATGLMSSIETTTFEVFFSAAEPGLRAALVAKFGAERGRDAAAEALGYGWRNWERVSRLDNPAGYLYRVGDRWGRRQRKPKRQPLLLAQRDGMPDVEPGLEPALDTLTLRQRQAVVLIAGFGLSHAEAADLLGLRRSSIQNHVERGLSKLRSELGVQT